MDRSRAYIFVVAAATLLGSLPALASPADGDLDPTFGGGDGYVHETMTFVSSFGGGFLHVGPDADFTMGGSVVPSSDPGNYDFAACRFERDGALKDCASFGFDYGSGGSDFAYGVGYQLDGRRVLAGSATGSAAEPETRIALLGLQATDVPDPDFGNNGRTNLDFAGAAQALAVATRRNGDVLVAGSYFHEVTSPGADYDCVVARLHDDGTPDASFSGNGQKTIAWDLGGGRDVCTGLALYGDGRVVVSGYASRPDFYDSFAVARLTADGDLDPTFSNDGKRTLAFEQGGQDEQAWAIALDRRNRIVVAGLVTREDGFQYLGVARLLDDGSLDDAFAGNGKLPFYVEDFVSAIEPSQVVILPPPGNDIVISGTYASANAPDTHVGFVVALHEDGTVDDSFAGDGMQTITIPGTSALTGAHMANQGGKLLLAGGFGGATNVDYWIVRLYRDAVFGDDFEGGKLRLWSDRADP